MVRRENKPRVGKLTRGRDECEAQTIGFAGARYKKFNNAADAEAYVAQFVPGLTANISASSTSAAASAAPALSVTNDGRWKGAAETLDDESGWDVVYSDGACKGNGKLVSIAGIGVWWGRSDSRSVDTSSACAQRVV